MNLQKPKGRLMNAHKYADLFPMMDDDELATLAADIKTNGLLEPIWTYKGEILDGRNRHKACGIAGVSPEIKEYTGDDPLGFVVALNLMRRHMTPAQRAMLGAELKAVYAEENKPGQPEKNPGKSTGISGDNRDLAADAGVYVDMAEQIKEKAPEIVDDVLRGEVPLKQAREIAKVTAPTARKRVLDRVKKDKANYEQTKRIISDETRATKPEPGQKNPDEIHFSWYKDKDVTEAEQSWSGLFTQAERMNSSDTQPEVSRDILNKWVAKAKNFVEAFDE
jgi:hypothetical protein